MSGEPDIVSREELAQIIIRDAALRDGLFCRAMSHTRDLHDAEDLLQETLTRSLDSAYAAWNRSDHLTPASCLGSVMNGIARNRLRSSYMARREDLDEQNLPQVAAPADDPMGKLTMAGTHRKRDDMVGALRARMVGKEVPLAVLDWTEKGVKGHVALSEKIGCTLKQVVAAERTSAPGIA
jgi:hypothetical protein